MKKKQSRKRVDTIEKLAVLTVEGFEQVDKRFHQVDKRFERIEQKLEDIDIQLKHIQREIADINRRIEYLEEQGARQAGYAKEIDYLLERVARIEKHLKLT